MSIANEITRINTNIASAYSAANSKGATMPQVQNSANLADTINSISGEQQTVLEKDINFFDYNGKLLYSYTFSEAIELTTLPTIPTHEGLTGQSWNYTLAQVVAYANDNKPLSVGATYTTSDGSTKLYLFVAKGTKIPSLKIYIDLDAGQTVTIDWGDGSEDTVSNTGSSTANVYAEKLNYTEVKNDTILCVKLTGGSFKIGNSESNSMFGTGYEPTLIRAELGNNCIGVLPYAFQNTSIQETVIHSGITSIPNYTFNSCQQLKAIVLPNSITSIGSYAFYSCFNLKTVVLPNNITSIGTYAFAYCYSLSMLSLPNSVSSIDTYAFYNCLSLINPVLPTSSLTAIMNNCFRNCKNIQTVKIPDTVMSFQGGAFMSCAKLYAFDITGYTDSSNLPTLANANAFSGADENMVFYVANEEMRDAFSNARNWSTYANKFVIAFDQRSAKAREFLDVDSEYTDYPETSTSPYMISHLQDAKYAPEYLDPAIDSKPSGVSVTIPTAGTLEIVDGSNSMSYSVSAGSQTIYNITPGCLGEYYLDNNKIGVIKPLKIYKHPLRMIYCKLTQNVRDLGGWSCDGGTIKYGKLFRGAKLFDEVTGSTADKNFDKAVFHDLLGVRYELDLRNDAAESTSSIGSDVLKLGVTGTYYNINDYTHYKTAMDCVINCAVNNIPLYFHCAEGADRTGTLAFLIEAILGVKSSDIDKDYELTTFNTGNDTDAHARRRNERDSNNQNKGWRVLMLGNSEVNGIYSLDEHEQPIYPGSSLRDKVISWALTIGLSLEQINAFRYAMIEGSPEEIVRSDSNV